MTPEMCCDIASLEGNNLSRQSRFLCSGDSTLIASNRFLIVPVDSSAARIPLPGVTIACATLLRSERFIAVSQAVRRIEMLFLKSRTVAIKNGRYQERSGGRSVADRICKAGLAL